MAAEPLDFDFFSRPAPSPAPPASPSTCPKCSWHQPDGAQVCAACGLIFAKFEAAEARRRASEAAVRPVVDGGAAPIPTTGEAFDAETPWPQSSAAPQAFSLRHEASALEISVLATRSAFSSALGLTLMNVVPLIVVIVLAAAGGTALGMARLGGGGIGTIALGVVVALVAIRILAGISAGSLIMIDDVMRNGESRGFVACFGDGFVRGGRALGVIVVSWLAMVACAMPAAAAMMTGNTKAALPLGVIGFVVLLVVGLRLSLALPAAVLGQLDVVSALQESVSLTKGSSGAIAVALLLSWLATAVVSLCSIPFSWVPLLGMVLVAIVNAINSGILLGTLAGLWRERRAATGWSSL